MEFGLICGTCQILANFCRWICRKTFHRYLALALFEALQGLINPTPWCCFAFPFILAQWAGIWVMKARATEVNPLIAVNIFEVEVKWPVFALVIYVIPLASRYAASLLASRYRPRWLCLAFLRLINPLNSLALDLLLGPPCLVLGRVQLAYIEHGLPICLLTQLRWVCLFLGDPSNG